MRLLCVCYAFAIAKEEEEEDEDEDEDLPREKRVLGILETYHNLLYLLLSSCSFSSE